MITRYLCGLMVFVGLTLLYLGSRYSWRIDDDPDARKAGNCWDYALAKWLRPESTYLVVRRSKYANWLHCFYAPSIDGLYVEEFKPLAPQRGWRAVMEALRFEGRVRKGEGEEI